MGASATHVNAKFTATEGHLKLCDEKAFRAGIRRLKPGDGEVFVGRFEREADAKKYHQLKWYYGYIVKQCVGHTGYTVIEMDTIFRALFLPPDVKTLSEASYEQLHDYNLQCEQYSAETIGVVIEGPDSARSYAA
jgi:hypothetical protein